MDTQRRDSLRDVSTTQVGLWVGVVFDMLRRVVLTQQELHLINTAPKAASED